MTNLSLRLRWDRLVIWNSILLDRIRQNRTYSYVPVCTSTYQYMAIQVYHLSTWQYILVRTSMYFWVNMLFSHTPMRVNYTSVQLACKRLNLFESNAVKFPKVKSSENDSTYAYIPVCTDTDWYRHHPQTHFIWITLYPLSAADESPQRAWLVRRALCPSWVFSFFSPSFPTFYFPTFRFRV